MPKSRSIHLALGNGDDELARLLRAVQLAIVRHPVAARMIVRALIGEGRAFLRTPAGEQWSRRLAGSALIRRGRLAWEATTMNWFEEDPPSILPSDLIDALALAVRSRSLEELLAGIRPSGVEK
jgi:hypothetical protein